MAAPLHAWPETSAGRLTPGAVLAAKYRVDRVLGTGGMATVFGAMHLQLGEPVAIKVLHRHVLRHPGAIDRFMREARVAMRLQSEHVARVFDLGTIDDGTPFIVMELLPGDDLATLLRDRGPFEVEDAVDYVMQACQAIAEAHAAGVVHRDLKPANLFLSPGIHGSPRVKVLDFGVSKLLAPSDAHVDPLSITAPPSSTSIRASAPGDARDLAPPVSERPPAYAVSMTHSQAILGSPRYMAPEQIRSARDVDARADVWALGVILHELVSGTHPFRGETLDALREHILERDPAPLVVGGGRLPDLEAALAGAFTKDPKGRYPDVRAFAEAMAGFASAEGQASFERILRMTERPGAHRIARRAASIPAAPRHGHRALAFAVLAITVSGVASLSTWVWRTRARRDASSVSAGVDPGSPLERCLSNRACTKANGGMPARCGEDGTCAPLASIDCAVHAGPEAIEADDTVWFGAMLPPSEDRTVANGEADLRAIDLARQDFSQMMSGFARSHGEAHVHPFGVIACDDSKSPMRAARHLVEVARVPAIIGFQSAAEVVDIGSSLLVPNGVAVVASLSTSPLVTSLPNRKGSPRLVWRSTFSSAETAKALGQIVPDLVEPKLRASRALLPSAPMRVAVVRTESRGGSTFNTLLFKALRFNGKSALDNGTDYRELVVDPAKLDTEIGPVAEALDAFAPHAIVLVVDAEMAIIDPLERLWSHTAYRPYYLFMSSFRPQLVDWLGSSASRRGRVFGLSPVANGTANARFVMHYNETAASKVTRAFAPDSSYDAFYLLAYATYALGDEKITGENLGRAMERLVPPGLPVDVGPAQIFDAFSALRRGESIDLNGATGSLDFDLATGEAPFDQAVLCAATDARGRTIGTTESGVIFRSAAGKLVGTMHCP